MVGSTGTIMTMRLVRSKLRKREDSATAAPPPPPTIVEPSSQQSHNRSSSINTTAALTHNHTIHNNNNNNNCFSEHHYHQQQQHYLGEQQKNGSTPAELQYGITSLQAEAVLNKNINNNCIQNGRSSTTTISSSSIGGGEERIAFCRTSGIGVVTTSSSTVAMSDVSSNGDDWIFPPNPPTPNIYCVTNDMLMVPNERNGFKGFRKQFSGRFKRLVVKKADPPPAIPPELKSQLKTIYVY